MGAAGNQNVQGEDQKKLDVLSNDIMISALTASGKTAVLVSEENDEAIFVKDNASDNLGKYCAWAIVAVGIGLAWEIRTDLESAECFNRMESSEVLFGCAFKSRRQGVDRICESGFS